MTETTESSVVNSTRQDFDSFKERIDAQLKQLEDEALATEKETEIVLQQNAKTNSNSQFLLAEISAFGKEMEQLKQEMSDAQK
ncbi:hypothetical protein ENUP19_0152G0015 [Entamoeba nuttalli]|uniref:Uncharacterized protein n=2 Tax=Entamoeba nuttalli TaxID=412467 RepID=K2I0C6_ENTNP|nr:hypothetical protein ENU1_029240 [Entamoeba nuttalli P19]EKE42195.1 hypothetical protein ENU1_029240 [Entamoeba nuttalli P19]|eukprot:XP_008855468.1 hypothetical protein ENU1_029240 [Entamoeba nuttalli P19]